MSTSAFQIVTFLAALLVLRCGSLLSELDRIKNKAANSGTPVADSAPIVLYTIPADGTVSAPVQAYVDIVYDQPIDPSSATGAGNNGACTGTVVASYNEFTNCGGTASVTGNTVRLSASPMPLGVAIKVRASGVRGTNGLTGVDYQSAVGFSFTSPCGQHCFYSDSAPLSGVTTASSGNFYVSGGTHAGKQIIVHGGTTATTLYNPATNQTTTGPILAGVSPGTGSHSFAIPSGTNAGHVLVFQGNGTNATTRYDLNTSTFVAGPTTGTNVDFGATSFLVTGGTYAGRVMTAVGGSLATTFTYDNAGNTFVGGSPSVGTLVGTGAHGYRLDSGPQIGQFRLLVGGSTTARYYDDASNAWNPGTNSNCTTNLPASFRVYFGAQAGKFYQVCGGGAGTNLYDQNASSLSGAVLPAGANISSIVIPYVNSSSNNGYLVFGGNGAANTMIYTASTDNWAVGPQANNLQNTGSNYFTINSGNYSGRHFIALGGGSGRTAMFDPATSKFSGTRPFSPLGIGGNYFNIKTGLHAGKVMIIGAGGSLSPNTTIYDPQTAEMIAGPNLAGGLTAGAGSHNFNLTSGPNAGKTMLINAQTSMNSQFYDPATNIFSMSGATGLVASVGNGASSFYISSGPRSGQYLLINGNPSAMTHYYDPATNTFSQILSICTVNTGSLTFTIPADGFFPGHQFILCGGTGTYRFDPSGPSVIAGAPLPSGSAGAGSSVIYLRSGIHAGKFLIIHAGGSTVTTLYQPSNDTLTIGPATTACTNIGVGSVSFEITAGANKGKFIITLGALTPQTCLYDPATNTFAFGPSLGPHPGYGTNDGTVVFPTGGGIYPTAYVLVHGGFFGTFSHFFQY